MLRVTGKNLQDGTASAWTTLQFTDSERFDTTGHISDVSVEFWTIYDDSCYSLTWDGCQPRDGTRAGAGATAYSFPSSVYAHDKESAASTQYRWRTSEQVLVYRVQMVVNRKARLLVGEDFRNAMLPACGLDQPNIQGIRRVCCSAEDYENEVHDIDR